MERRQSTRRPASFEVLLSKASGDAWILQAVNTSAHGLYLLSEGEELPSIGSLVQIRLNEQNDAPLLDMLIKRVDLEGIGLQFIQHHRA